ncbi:hypothetical protein RND71_006173 [Anisodus tanguticus]|uniref:Uncharacterized protein n=1 Tax=Anisodus tanguticus TaxID=243964 RepID=A0AAE1STI3_9SOLA|nr:hypothetical protein RND71_006173 [Anisodus tanguticus]
MTRVKQMSLLSDWKGQYKFSCKTAGYAYLSLNGDLTVMSSTLKSLFVYYMLFFPGLNISYKISLSRRSLTR